MGLSCDCDFDGDGYFEVDDADRVALSDFKCYGCCKPFPSLIEVRVLRFYNIVEEDEDMDEFDEVTTGHARLCPACSGLYDSLIELGFCLGANWGFIAEAMQEYRDNYLTEGGV